MKDVSGCCTEPGCRRQQPILLRRDPFRSSEKHILDEQAQHMLGGAFVAPGEEEQDRADAVRHSAAAVRTLMVHLGLDPDRRTASGHDFAEVLAAAALNIPLDSAGTGAVK